LGISLEKPKNCVEFWLDFVTPNARLFAQVFAALLVIGLGYLFCYRLNTLGWPGDFRSPSNRMVTAMGILLFGIGIFWIVAAILQRFGK